MNAEIKEYSIEKALFILATDNEKKKEAKQILTENYRPKTYKNAVYKMVCTFVYEIVH